MGEDSFDGVPTFTVIIATHNRAHLLPRAVKSVLGQPTDQFEIIVVDDASSDNTLDVVTAFADPRVRYLRTKKQSGAAGARNLGARNALGRLLVFLDDDDELAPTFLPRAAAEMADQRYGFALVWRAVTSDETGLDAPIRVRRLTLSGETRLERREWFYQNRMPGGTGGLIVQKSCYLAVGGCDETFLRLEDTDLFIRMVEQYDFTVIPEELYIIHLHDGNELDSLIRLSLPIAQASLRLLTKHSHILERYPQLRWYTTKRAVQYYYLSGNAATGKKVLWQLFRSQPGKPEVAMSFLMYGLFGLLPQRWYQAIFEYLYKRRRQRG